MMDGILAGLTTLGYAVFGALIVLGLVAIAIGLVGGAVAVLAGF
jgi:hypothetical protein